MPKPGDKVDIEDGLEFACPWCGKPCVASATAACVMHPSPTCEGFDTHEAHEIVAESNRRQLS